MLSALAGLVIGITLRSLEACAQGMLRRPANFYHAVYQADPLICRQALSSLNKPYTLDAGEAGEANSAAKLLLSSPSEAKWEQKWLPLSEHNTWLEAAQADLSHQGKPEIVYRESFFLKDEGENDLIVTPYIGGVLGSDARLSSEALKHIRGEKGANYVWITDKTIPQLAELRKLPPLGGTWDSTVMTVAGSGYILITEAGAADKALKDGVATLEVFLLRFHSPRNLSVVCQFRSK